MNIENQIEAHEFTGEGYKPLIDFDKWRVAILNDGPKTYVDTVSYMQKHTITDEVFILLKGKCTLYCAGRGEELGKIEAMPLEPGKFYNVKNGTWHTHILDHGTSVVVVENMDTGLHNSPCIDLTDEQKKIMAQLF